MRYETEHWCVEARPALGAVAVTGEFDGSAGGALEAWLSTLRGWSAEARLDLSAMELADAGGAVAVINLIRRLRETTETVVVAGAPQAVGHGLYRIGMLEPGRGIRMEQMREDEPFG